MAKRITGLVRKGSSPRTPRVKRPSLGVHGNSPRGGRFTGHSNGGRVYVRN